jgi:hypothetical protein
MALDLGEIRRRDGAELQHIVVEYPRAVFADRAHRDFGLARKAELADDEHIERRIECLGHLGGDRYPAPWESEHHRSIEFPSCERLGETSTRVAAVREALHTRTPPHTPRCTGRCSNRQALCSPTHAHLTSTYRYS